MEVMANNGSILYCQSCRQPHPKSFNWLLWHGFRIDSEQCLNGLKARNIDILKQEALAKINTIQIAEDYRKELLTNPPKRKKYKRKLKPVDLDKYIFNKPKGNEVNCPSCNKTIPKLKRKCPLCLNYTKPLTTIFPTDYPTKQRNQEIVSLLEQGIFTLDQIGKRYGVTRERIRQLYKKMTGKPYDFRQEAVNITKLLDKWQQKQVKPVTHPSLGIYDAFFFRYRQVISSQGNYGLPLRRFIK